MNFTYISIPYSGLTQLRHEVQPPPPAAAATRGARVTHLVHHHVDRICDCGHGLLAQRGVASSPASATHNRSQQRQLEQRAQETAARLRGRLLWRVGVEVKRRLHTARVVTAIEHR
jgi:hypothetical protein